MGEINMSLEPGGMGDKLGNMYEDRYFAVLMLRLVRERIKAITVEKLGPVGDYSEYITEEQNGRERYFQCKASNGTKPQWGVSDLERYDVFDRIKEILLGDRNAEYCFVSPLKYTQLDELCNRARNSSTYEEWYNYQINNEVIRKTFNACAKAFGYDIQKAIDREAYYVLLSRCYFETFQYDTEELQDRIELIFSGEPSTILILLEQYAKATNSLRKRITASNVVEYLEKQNVYLLNFGNSNTVFQRIQTINEVYWGNYPAIHGTLIHRTESLKLIDAINKGKSAILHGKAGMGKSGCLQELVNYLKENQILYLTIKLDKYIPEKSARNFGSQLGLPGSPVYCLASLAAQKHCVLILDQLDALRWSNIHSGDALTICREMIREAERINRLENGNISLVFSSRTFDLENDAGLRSLFENGEDSPITWSRIKVEPFSDDELVRIIGDQVRQFSPKLQDILRTPSSLFVWTRLNSKKHRNPILSVYGLMEQWWNQIQGDCQKIGIPYASTAACKDRVVGLMSGRKRLYLPPSMLSDQCGVVNALISQGLLSQDIDANKLFFTHQSFLDYFLSVNMLSDVYSGKDLVQILGPRDEQVPAIRYRLLTVLQQLLESDSTLFLEQAKKIIGSDHVRFYIQCGVFEVLGQHSAPGQESVDFANQYMHDSIWHDFVLQSVFMGHPRFVERYQIEKWMSPTARNLLRSVSYLIPDFVVGKLRPYAFQSSKQDRDIYDTLCPNPSDDSEEMFHFRLALIKKNPDLLQHFIPVLELMETSSICAIDLLEVLLSSKNVCRSSHLYLGEEKTITGYVTTYYQQIVERLFPLICIASSDFKQIYENNNIFLHEEDWINRKYNESTARKIVNLVKQAFSIFGKNAPEECLHFMGNYNAPISAVGHELILQGLRDLPIEYADTVLSWLLRDFSNRIFCFSEKERDYLYAAKQIIAKFSGVCTDEVFGTLESKIVFWKEPVGQMMRCFKARMEANQEKKYPPFFYAYWGHLQKELLPCLEKERTTAYTKELIEVLNRNDWIRMPHFTCGIYGGDAVSVSSPVDKKLSRIGDRTWLQIIATPEEKMSNRWSGSTGVEASHWSFASSMGRQAKIEPERFLNLLPHFPDQCPQVYVYNVLSAAAYTEKLSTMAFECLEQAITRYGNSSDLNVAIEISRVVEKFSDYRWSEETMEIIKNIARFHKHPEGNGCKTDENDPDATTVDRVQSGSYNCARGCAIHAIAALIWKDSTRGIIFKDTVLSAVEDPHASVRFALMDCALAYYNMDPQFSIGIAKNLIKLDLRIVAAHGFWQVISRNYIRDTEYYRSILIQSAESDVKDLGETAAEYLCAVAVYYDKSIIDYIAAHQFTQAQKDRICRQAIFSFDDEQYHERSLQILMLFLSTQRHGEFSRLFTDKCVRIRRDADFIGKIMINDPDSRTLHSFFNFFSNLNSEHELYAPILAEIGKSYKEYKPGEMYKRSTEFAKCINILFDKAGKNPQVQTICLDIWDDFFKNQMYDAGSYRMLSNLLNSY